MRIWWLLLLIPLAGCAELFGRQGIPADPLFANGKPAEAKTLAGPARPAPFSEPTPPINKTRLVQY